MRFNEWLPAPRFMLTSLRFIRTSRAAGSRRQTLNVRKKFMCPLWIALTITCCSAFAIDDPSLSWKAFADMLGTSVDSHRQVLEKCGPAEKSTNGDGQQFIRYPFVGVTFRIYKETIGEIHFAVEDGKKISERRFNGELPFVPLGATWHNYTMQQALASHGKPISEDREGAYLKLSYPKGNIVVMLYFLETRFAGVAVKKLE